MMQLACIVNMVSQWSKATVRVCVCNEATRTSFSVNSNLLSHTDKLGDLLKILRISAQLYCISEWDQVLELQHSDTENYLKRYMKQIKLNVCGNMFFFFRVNQLLNAHSSDTAVTFIYLPTPMVDDETAPQYLSMLEMITENLPPTILVHGISTVTSTTL